MNISVDMHARGTLRLKFETANTTSWIKIMDDEFGQTWPAVFADEVPPEALEAAVKAFNETIESFMERADADQND